MDIVSNFKQMPLLLKILFIFSVYSLGTSIVSLVGMKQVDFSYFFGSNFPRNFPFIWSIYSVSLGALGIYIFLKRSYSLLVKYNIFTAVVLIFSFLNSMYSTFFTAMPETHIFDRQTTQMMLLGVYFVIYGLSALLIVYTLKQKKYFNKP